MVTDRQPAGAGGFTLIEMMVALAILLVGVSALMSALTSGVDLRRSSDARLEASMLAEEAFRRVQTESMRRKPDGQSALDLGVMPFTDQETPGFPGMHWSAVFVDEPTRPDIVLVRIEVKWQEKGDEVEQDFQRVLTRSEPMGVRVARFRTDNALAR
jgi:prepilin-type N-terminal cleavage/methylation domain-containing protein